MGTNPEPDILEQTEKAIEYLNRDHMARRKFMTFMRRLAKQKSRKLDSYKTIRLLFDDASNAGQELECSELLVLRTVSEDELELEHILDLKRGDDWILPTENFDRYEEKFDPPPPGCEPDY